LSDAVDTATFGKFQPIEGKDGNPRFQAGDKALAGYINATPAWTGAEVELTGASAVAASFAAVAVAALSF